ncbi:hypothetical protein EC957_007616 [Mortierella hygrophila]|uniref:Cyclin-domain-containing protein n=1 Tax=Mortierella hygrophila TaxID=979708 RepID=A0A9P6FC08_9FUNG|nr:hypothetical protein EC957_007616 [Mortierella hygrophila]
MHALDLSIHPVTSTLKMLASLLERITTANDKIKQGLPEPDTSMVVMTPAQHQIHTSFTRFHARSIPSISINAYLTRILKYCPCANECFLSLLVYFDRMARNVEEITGGEGRQFSIDSYNIHRLIIAGIMVSAKYFSDVFFTNSRYAKVGGLPVSELNQLEVEFLTLNNFALAISIEELQTYGDQLMKHWMCEEVAHRDAEDDTASPAVPAALMPGSTSGSRDQQNGDSAQDSQGQVEQHAQESRQDPSRSQQHHQYESSRRDVRQEPAPDHHQGQSRHDYRHNGSEPHPEHRREQRQEHMRDYRQEHARSQNSSQSQHSQPSRSHSQHHHQQREQQQQQQQQHYKNGSSSRHHRPGHDSEYPSDKSRYHTPQQAPISPSEMTHATSRLAAPSPIH